MELVEALVWWVAPLVGQLVAVQQALGSQEEEEEELPLAEAEVGAEEEEEAVGGQGWTH